MALRAGIKEESPFITDVREELVRDTLPMF